MYLDKVDAIRLTKQIQDDYLDDSTKATQINYDSNNNIMTSDYGTYTEYRYIGSSPNNYVYFNCDDNETHSDSSWYSSHCEKWRIIGSMDTNTTGYTADSNDSKDDGHLVKIIRDSLGGNSWDSKGSGTGSSTYVNGSNDWSDSQLMMMLNSSTYLNQGYRVNSNALVNTTTVHGRTYSVDNDGYVVYTKTLNSVETTQKVMKITYNSNLSEWAGGYYNRSAKACKPSASSLATDANYECNEVDYSKVGLKDEAKDYIQEIEWKIGGHNTTAVTTNNMYIAERDKNVVNANRPTTWKGKVALMYATDWALATALSTETSTGSGTYCKDTTLNSWSSYSACYNNWLYTGSWQWTLAPWSGSVGHVFEVNTLLDAGSALGTQAVRPVLYLKTSTLVTGGSGTSSDPYQLLAS